MRKILCTVLILLICFVTTFTYAEEDNDNNTVDLQQQRSDLQNQLNEAMLPLTVKMMLKNVGLTILWGSIVYTDEMNDKYIKEEALI